MTRVMKLWYQMWSEISVICNLPSVFYFANRQHVVNNGICFSKPQPTLSKHGQLMIMKLFRVGFQHESCVRLVLTKAIKFLTRGHDHERPRSRTVRFFGH